MGELDDIDAVELIRTQSRVNVPSQGPAPVPQDGIRGNAQPRYQRPRAAPAQAAPAQPMPAPQQQPDMPSDPVDAWIGMMNKHGIDRSKWPSLSDQYYEIDRNGQVPRTGNPALDNDLTQYARRFPKQGQPTPQPQSPQLPQPPAAQQQLGAAPRQQGMPPAPMDELGDVDAMDVMRGPAQQQAAAPRAADPNAEPDAPTWLGRRMQDVRGRQDPRFAGLPNIASVIQKRGQSWGDLGGETFSWAVGASDKDMARTYQAMLGRDYIRTEQDANGYPVIVYRDNGQEAKAYVNNPGIDMQDVARGAFGALPFVVSGVKVAQGLKNAPVAGRVFAQGGGQAATSIAQDAAAVGSGVSDLNLTQSGLKAGVAGAAGMGGEVAGAALGPIIRRYITEPRYYNRAAGTLTPEGEQVLKASGVDPSAFSPDLIRSWGRAFARTRDPEIALSQAGSNKFNVPRTQGELTRDQAQLLREQSMTGPDMKAFRDRQGEAIRNALVGEIEPGVPGLAGQIAPARAGRPLGRDELGANIVGSRQAALTAAKAEEKAAWKAFPEIKATPEALAELDAVVAKRTADVMVDPIVDGVSLTPAAAKMDKALAAFKEGKMPGQTSVVPNAAVGDVGAMRKRLLKMKNAAATPEDQRAAGAIYNAFIDWEVVAAEKAGNLAAAAQARSARQITREVHQLFDGKPGSNAASILKSAFEKDTTPEAVINTIFSGTSGQTRAGSAGAIDLLFKAYDRYLTPAAAQISKQDVSLAYVMRLVEKSGETPGPKAIASALRSAAANDPTLFKMLFNKQQQNDFMMFARIMSDVARRNPNTSWSGITVGQMFKDGFDALLNVIGWNSVAGKVAGNIAMKPIRSSLDAARFSTATGGGQGAQAPTVKALPSLGGYGGALGSQSQQ